MNLSMAPTTPWETFYSQNPPPKHYDETKEKINKFVNKHSSNGSSIVLVTSGGTTVPLEHNTVRFVDNFSAGTRGSASAEYFLCQDYAVIFLHRLKSLQPYSRHFPSNSLLHLLQTKKDGSGKTSIEVIPEQVDTLLPILKSSQEVEKSGRLLLVTFETLPEYLHLLRAAAHALQPLQKKALLYLAAAVSDFYVPPANMSTHKIHSNDGPLHLHLELVPKVLQPLVRHWVPEAFVVSFKLETDENILVEKAQTALDRYGHQLVVANELHSRKTKVILVEKNQQSTISLSAEELAEGTEIETKIVADIVRRHLSYLETEIQT